MLKRTSIALLIFSLLNACTQTTTIPVTQRPGSLHLSYNQPAKHWMNEALPIGNGRFGALVQGNPVAERLVLNESSLWTGDDNPSGDYKKMGSYQKLGELVVSLHPADSMPTDYRRGLDIGQALASVQYTLGDTQYRREILCSHPDQVLAAQFTASKRGAYSGTLEFQDGRKAATVASDNRLICQGTLSNGMKHETQVLVLNESGQVRAEGSRITFSGCDKLTVLIVAGTNYVMDHSRGYRGDDPHARLTQQLLSALAKGYPQVRSHHIADYQSLFNRVALDLGPSPDDRTSLLTDQRKLKAAEGGDPELESLLFQYGRYLMIACSRPGGLPANLQGLWNDSNTPPWHSDYHANINVQMNYWPVETTNLSECHTPLFDLIQSQLEPWRKATAASKSFKVSATGRGFAIRTSHGIHGDLGWKWDKTANAWYCQHLWEHYAFGLDSNYLRTVAYPILKETCQFWEDHLKTLPDGRLVVPNGWSPEHGPEEDGVSYNQQIVWDLFTNYVQAADALGIDKDYRNTIAAMRDKLVGPKIGKWGQLQEWMEDRDDPNDHHRHTSHLFAIFPGRQIGVSSSPEFAAAAKKSLEARGDVGDVREWSFAWRTALWARLRDAEKALSQVRHFFAGRNSCPNLYGLHPPMQIDGNFGVTAGIAEMLVQSHDNEIHLLPALPSAWSTGAVKGLRARGGFTVDIAWKDGKVAAYRIASSQPRSVSVRVGDQVKTIVSERL